MDYEQPVAGPSKRRAPSRTAAQKRKPDANPSGASDTKRPRIVKKKGCLQGLLDISLDVLFEVFGNLQPLDVLRLSRTSKEFRNLLMHKSAVTIWRSSLRNVPGLPSCPTGMTEPQWVSLVFDATCQVCQKTARKVDWGLFIRICGKCAKVHLSTFNASLTATGAMMYYQLIPTRPDHTKHHKTVYFAKELGRVRAVCNGMKNPDEQKKYVKERKELVKTLKELTKECEAWSETLAENRSTELADLRQERYNGIVAKLTEIGWGAEIDGILPADSLKTHKLVKQPTALTERTWNTIKPEMVRYMEEMKVKRLAREHAAIVVKRKVIATKVLRTFKRSQLPWTEVMPGGADFCEFPEIKDVLLAAAEVDVNEQTFEAMIPDFPRMMAAWREGLVQELVKVCKRSGVVREDEADNDIKARLPLATSVYKCTGCNDDDDGYVGFGSTFEAHCRPLFWPRVLAHRCLTQTPDFYVTMMLFMNATRDVAWRASQLAVDLVAAEIVEKVVTVCGLDPNTATVEDMDAVDARLACHTCSTRLPAPPAASSSVGPSADGDAKAEGAGETTPAEVCAYSWRNAVRHDGEVHDRIPTAWYLLGEEETTAVRVMEKAAIKARTAMDARGVVDSDDEYMPDAPGADESESETAETDTMQDVKATSGDTTQASDPKGKGVENIAIEDDTPVGILPSSLPEPAWSCAHCLESPQEKAPTALDAMRLHLVARHSVPAPGVLNEDYYRAPAAPEVYGSIPFPAPSLVILALPPTPPMVARRPKHRSMHDFMHDLLYRGQESDEDGWDDPWDDLW
ncbi:hypothetical protein DFH07DRAFT_822306 [Mycena maculata]|uniref:F-box domain-containing protein n=1 Tax=Mycena maculata TaxID=230809 RepID=A0AAD7NBL7_9AGAR|nr:hypothetical protein DFH07DRAFT_822306 [Mycena maculata]